MTTFSKIKAPFITLVKQVSEPPTPDADTLRLFIADADGLPYLIDESDTVTEVGGGDGGTIQSHYPIPMWSPDANTNFFTVSATSASDYYLLSSGAQNDLADWNINLPAGTYKWILFHVRDNNRGKYHLLLDGSDVGNIDGYNVATGIAVNAVAGITVAGASPTVVRIKMSDKNASSSAYYGTIFQSYLIRTGA